MTPELQRLLYERYPAFFAQRTWSIRESCMPWGCDTNDGWFSLIDAAAEAITGHADALGRPPSQASQVKEKYGSLRIYLSCGDDFDHAVTDMAELLSIWVCELTGRPGRLADCDGYIHTLCPEMALRDGIKMRVSMPRPSARSRKYRSILRGPINVPRGWLRIADCMLLGLLGYTRASPISIERIAVEDDRLQVAVDSLPTDAAGVLAFCQAVALRTDQRTGALHVPPMSENESRFA